MKAEQIVGGRFDGLWMASQDGYTGYGLTESEAVAALKILMRIVEDLKAQIRTLTRELNERRVDPPLHKWPKHPNPYRDDRYWCAARKESGHA